MLINITPFPLEVKQKMVFWRKKPAGLYGLAG